MLLKQCQLEYHMMQNALAIARSPDVFAYHFMKRPRYMTLLTEVIHMIKCVSIEVKLVQTTECYEQLPVIIRRTETNFLTPQMHILIRHGT